MPDIKLSVKLGPPESNCFYASLLNCNGILASILVSSIFMWCFLRSVLKFSLYFYKETSHMGFGVYLILACFP